MATTKAQQKAVTKYVKSKYDRFGLTMPKGNLEKIKVHAAALGESVNGFIGRAIDETMRRDSGAQEAPLCLSDETISQVKEVCQRTGETIEQFIARSISEQAKQSEAFFREPALPQDRAEPGKVYGA